MIDQAALVAESGKGVHYETILASAINAVTTFGGQKWTDLSDHDPGVTLIQALSFVAADLCYRNTLPLADLLTPAPPEQADGLFPVRFGPQTALCCSPVTPDDYRRGVLDLHNPDRQPYFRNVTVVREPEEERFTYYYDAQSREFLFESVVEEDKLALLGNFNVFAERARGQDRAAAKAALEDYLRQHRNLGEGVGRVELMEATDVNLGIDIELAGDVSDPAKVMADIFTAADRFLSPFAERHFAEELRAAGLANDVIYAGPRLQHGWITNLPPGVDYGASEVVNFAPLVNSLLAIDGVNSIFRMSLDPESQSWNWTRPAESFGWLWSEQPFEVLARGEAVRLFKKGQQLLPSAAEIEAHVAVAQPIFDLPGTMVYGRFRGPGRYYSVTSRLPKIYGMQSLAPSSAAFELYQFLLSFEQMFANAADQLAQLPRTLSFERDGDTRQRGARWPYTSGSLADGVHADYARGLKRYVESAGFDLDKELETIDYLLGYFGAGRAPRMLEAAQAEYLTVQRGILRDYAEYGYNRANVRIDEVSALQRRIAARLGVGSQLFDEQSIDLSNLPFYIVEHRALLPRQPNPDHAEPRLALGAVMVPGTADGSFLRIHATEDPAGIAMSAGQAVDLIVDPVDANDPYAVGVQLVVRVEGGSFDLDPANSRHLETNLDLILAAAEDGRLSWCSSDTWLKDFEYPLDLDLDQSGLGEYQYRILATPFPAQIAAGDMIQIFANASSAASSPMAALAGEVLLADPLFHRLVIQLAAPLAEGNYHWYLDKPINDRFSLQASVVFDSAMVHALAEPSATAAWISAQVQAEMPGHIQPIIQWLPTAEYQTFGTIYNAWQNSGQPLGDISYQLLYWLAIGRFPSISRGIGSMVIATDAEREAIVGTAGDSWDEAALEVINPVHVPKDAASEALATATMGDGERRRKIGGKRSGRSANHRGTP